MTIDRCSICNEPAHASETDDFNRCAKCRRKARKAGKKPRTVHVTAADAEGLRWLKRQCAMSNCAVLGPDGFTIINEGVWRQALAAAGAVEIK